jgi:hypothetical protein
MIFGIEVPSLKIKVMPGKIFPAKLQRQRTFAVRTADEKQ